VSFAGDLRRIERRDAARLADLLGQLGYPADEPEVHRRLDYWLDDPANVLLGADDDGLLIGVAALHVGPILEVTGKFGRLVALVVDDRYRGRGVGRALMAAIEHRALDLGCILMEVTSGAHRDASHRFYAGVGYSDSRPGSRRFTKFLSGR
jgi:GNAT superfamily N-acetyltransferase